MKIEQVHRLDSLSRSHATKEFQRQHEMDLIFSTPVRSPLTRKAFLFPAFQGCGTTISKRLSGLTIAEPNPEMVLRLVR
jgi:hypothetical protein